MPLTQYAQTYFRVKDVVEQHHREIKCINVSNLAKELKMNPRTLRKYLVVFEIDGLGHLRKYRGVQLFCKPNK